MTLEGFRSPLPGNYFADGRRLQVRSKGSVEERRDSLVDLLNDLREAIGGGSYLVDPDTTDDRPEFESVNAAYAAAHAALPAGEPVVLELAIGKDHVLDGVLTLDTSRDVYIRAGGSSEDSFDATPPFTKISGTITMQDCTGEASRRYLGFSKLAVACIINGNQYTNISMTDCQWAGGTINRTHGTGFPVGGCLVNLTNVTNNNGAFKVVDTDAASFYWVATVGLIRCQLFTPSGAASIEAFGPIFLDIEGCTLEEGGSNGVFADCNNTQSYIRVRNTLFNANNPCKFLDNLAVHAGSLIKLWDFRVVGTSGAAIDVGFNTTANVEGTFEYTGSVAPTGLVDGVKWHDTELNDVLVWDGIYWGANGIYRKDVLVDIGVAALDHDIGWNVPANGAVVSTSVKLLKLLTGAGGAVQVGFGTGSGGTSDKYAETASLAADQKDQNLHGTFNDGAGDDLKITAETAPGTSGGTVAGSGDEDVRAVVYFKLPKVLP